MNALMWIRTVYRKELDGLVNSRINYSHKFRIVICTHQKKKLNYHEDCINSLNSKPPLQELYHPKSQRPLESSYLVVYLPTSVVSVLRLIMQ